MRITSSRISQCGMALLICMIFLTALTLLGLSASADTVLQNRLVANFQETERVKQAALSTLSKAEDWLLSLDGPAPDYCQKPCTGLYVHLPGDLPTHPEFESVSWWRDHGYEAGLDPLTGEPIEGAGEGIAGESLWLIEASHSIPPGPDGPNDLLVWYRILARGSDHEEAVVSVVESTIVRSWSSLQSPGVAGQGHAVECQAAKPKTECGRVSWRELR